MVASLAVSLDQPVGDLLDLLGCERCWPEVFDALADINLARAEEAEKRAREQRQKDLIAKVKARQG